MITTEYPTGYSLQSSLFPFLKEICGVADDLAVSKLPGCVQKICLEEAVCVGGGGGGGGYQHHLNQ